MKADRALVIGIVAAVVVCGAACSIAWAQEEGAPPPPGPSPWTPNATEGPFVEEGSELLRHGDEQDEEHEAWEQRIEAVGIATLAFLVATIILGLMRRRSPRAMLKWHVRLAIVTLVLALVHLLWSMLDH
jgi:Mn2+/Fe2+ NRAMP family transporter